MPGGQCDDELTMRDGERIRHHEQAAVGLAGECLDGAFNLGGVVHRRHGQLQRE